MSKKFLVTAMIFCVCLFSVACAADDNPSQAQPSTDSSVSNVTDSGTESAVNAQPNLLKYDGKLHTLSEQVTSAKAVEEIKGGELLGTVKGAVDISKVPAEDFSANCVSDGEEIYRCSDGKIAVIVTWGFNDDGERVKLTDMGKTDYALVCTE